MSENRDPGGMGIVAKSLIVFCLVVVVGVIMYFKMEGRDPEPAAANDAASSPGPSQSMKGSSFQENLPSKPARPDSGKALPRLVDLGRGT